jgi:hypothetical protein
MKPMKDIAQIPVPSCPLCGEKALTIAQGGKKFLIWKNPDTVKCSNCGALFLLSEDALSLRYESIPSPYAYFNEYYSDWVSPGDASQLAEAIRTNSKAALSYLPDAKKHAWNIRIILGATGSADARMVRLEFSWEDEPASKDEGKRELARIRQIQKEVRQAKREMGQEMKEIRAYYGRSKENQPAKAAALEPYENTALVADQALVQLDGGKLSIQNYMEDHY